MVFLSKQRGHFDICIQIQKHKNGGRHPKLSRPFHPSFRVGRAYFDCKLYKEVWVNHIF